MFTNRDDMLKQASELAEAALAVRGAFQLDKRAEDPPKPETKPESSTLWQDISGVAKENPWTVGGLGGAGIGALLALGARQLSPKKRRGNPIRDLLMGALLGGGAGALGLKSWASMDGTIPDKVTLRDGTVVSSRQIHDFENTKDEPSNKPYSESVAETAKKVIQPFASAAAMIPGLQGLDEEVNGFPEFIKTLPASVQPISAVTLGSGTGLVGGRVLNRMFPDRTATTWKGNLYHMLKGFVGGAGFVPDPVTNQRLTLNVFSNNILRRLNSAEPIENRHIPRGLVGDERLKQLLEDPNVLNDRSQMRAQVNLKSPGDRLTPELRSSLDAATAELNRANEALAAATATPLAERQAIANERLRSASDLYKNVEQSVRNFHTQNPGANLPPNLAADQRVALRQYEEAQRNVAQANQNPKADADAEARVAKARAEHARVQGLVDAHNSKLDPNSNRKALKDVILKFHKERGGRWRTTGNLIGQSAIPMYILGMAGLNNLTANHENVLLAYYRTSARYRQALEPNKAGLKLDPNTDPGLLAARSVMTQFEQYLDSHGVKYEKYKSP
jgi:hypothetical protein